MDRASTPPRAPVGDDDADVPAALDRGPASSGALRLDITERRTRVNSAEMNVTKREFDLGLVPATQ